MNHDCGWHPMPDGWFPAETKESRADIAPDESRCEAAFLEFA